MEEEEDISFTDYSEGEKLYGFCILYTGAFFYEGLRVRCACESIAGINCVVVCHNRYAFYDVCAFFKLWKEFNKDY